MNKKYRYSIIFVCIIMLICLIILFRKESSKTSGVTSNFLEEFYEITNSSEEMAMAQFIKSYNKKFDAYLTEECLTTLWKNRYIIEYLSFLKKYHCIILVEDVELEETKKTDSIIQYSYKLQLRIKKGNKEKEAVGAGIIKMEEMDTKDWKISYFRRTDIKTLYKLAESL